MPRTRISTTVDSDALAAARASHGGRSDSELVDLALRALLATDAARRERAALRAQPYELDDDLAWSRSSAPPLPYDGAVPPEVAALARERRAARDTGGDAA